MNFLAVAAIHHVARGSHHRGLACHVGGMAPRSRQETRRREALATAVSLVVPLFLFAMGWGAMVAEGAGIAWLAFVLYGILALSLLAGGIALMCGVAVILLMSL